MHYTEGAKALASNTSLTTLEMSYNQIGPEGAKALASNMSLTTLYVSYNQIGPEGAKALASNKSLRTLEVSRNQIGPEGAKALASNTSTEIWVRDDHGPEGAKALAETDPHKRANYGREAGINTDVPSLSRLCLFKVKQYQLNQSQLPDDLHKKLAQPKV